MREVSGIILNRNGFGLCRIVDIGGYDDSALRIEFCGIGSRIVDSAGRISVCSAIEVIFFFII